MLTDLADLLRLSLRHTAAQEVPLREELGFLGRYLDIMRVRFADRLAITVDAGQDVQGAMVPSLALQPLVENAIRHGMEGRTDRGHVAVRAERSGGDLRLEVSDDGPGLGARPRGDGNGIGLANTRERLARLYGPAARLETVNADGHGLTVRLTIPLRIRADA
jgi:sensor histidine kinase YesM